MIVLEDDEILRAHLVREIRASKGLELAGQGASVAEGLAVLETRPSLALVDLRLLDGLALPLIRAASERGVVVVVLTCWEDDEMVFRALEAGAVGYLTKGDPHARITEALEAALAGGSPMSPSIARRVLQRLAPRPHASEPELSRREQEIAELFSRGATYDDVGTALGISVNTVRHHVRAMYEKLHVASKAELVARYLAPR